MAMNYTDEEYHQMTFEEVFEEKIKPNLYGVSRIFAEARKQMKLKEYKTFVYALSKQDWTQPCPDTIRLDKKELAEVLGIHSDIDHLSRDLMDEIGEMPKNSFLRFSDRDKDLYVNGCFVITIASFPNIVRIRLNPDYISLFGSLDGKERSYITMWSADIFAMKSMRTALFYELLRDNSDTREDVNVGTVSIKKFKEMFDIPKDGKGSYMREKGGFNRSEFEKKVIDPVCDELLKTEMIRLMLTPEGKPYEKVKRGKRVIAYKFWWTLTNPKEKAQIEKKEPEPAIDKPAELWASPLEEFNFSKEELEAIHARLVLVPQWNMLSNGAAPGSLELDQYHFMEMRAKDIKIADRKSHIKNKCKYLIKMLENDYIPKAKED